MFDLISVVVFRSCPPHVVYTIIDAVSVVMRNMVMRLWSATVPRLANTKRDFDWIVTLRAVRHGIHECDDPVAANAKANFHAFSWCLFDYSALACTPLCAPVNMAVRTGLIIRE